MGGGLAAPPHHHRQRRASPVSHTDDGPPGWIGRPPGPSAVNPVVQGDWYGAIDLRPDCRAVWESSAAGVHQPGYRGGERTAREDRAEEVVVALLLRRPVGARVHHISARPHRHSLLAVQRGVIV